MDYRVVITPEAQKAIDSDLAFIRLQASPVAANRWFSGLVEAIASLSVMPMRCRVIPESCYFEPELRQLLYGRRHHVRRIIFIIEGDTVHVVHYRHGSLPQLDGSEDVGSAQ
jgi:plasmid stabilization system protein ParE